MPTASPSSRRVLVIGVDGVRLDVLRRVDTPHLDAIAEAGFLAPVATEPSAPTLSGPCWATIATGVTPELHGVLGNDLTGHRLAAFPDFLTRLAAQGISTYAAASWAPLVTTAAGGPLFAAPGRLCYVAYGDDPDSGHDRSDAQVTADARLVLATDDPVASFVYLNDPDHIAHTHGCGNRYEAAISRADARIGLLLRAVRARSEECTVIVVTDHGQVDEGGHGGASEAERTAWIAACGPGVPAAPAGPIRHTDVAAQVHAALGLPVPRDAALCGRAFTAPGPA
jgi:predicted AlkP superfamily pyrophosphatase or phosphodiesterase